MSSAGMIRIRSGTGCCICCRAAIETAKSPPGHQTHRQHGIQKESRQHFSDGTPGRHIVIGKLFDLGHSEQRLVRGVSFV